MMRTKMFSLIALTSAFAGGLAFVSMTGTATAGSVTSDLCVATGIKYGANNGGCVYSSPDVPVLSLDVCWDGSTARVKGLSNCPGTQRTYYVKFGELINPMSAEIVAYAPLPDACNLVACEQSDINSLPFEDGVACCNPDTGDCWEPDPNGHCSAGEVTWCKELEDNGDNTVTCHE